MPRWPNWYKPEEADGDLVLEATVDLGSKWGKVYLSDPPEYKRRTVQAAARAILGDASIDDARTGKVQADRVDFDKMAKLTLEKLRAYVASTDKLNEHDGWDVVIDKVPAKLIDRVVLGIDFFTGWATPVGVEPEGNGQATSTGSVPRQESYSSELPAELATNPSLTSGSTSGSSSIWSTRAEPGSSPAPVLSEISPRGLPTLTVSS